MPPPKTAKHRRLGRPPTADPRTHVVKMCLSESQFAALTRRASLEGRTIAGMSFVLVSSALD